MEGLTVMLCGAPALKVLLVGLKFSQLEPLVVVADHEPAGPQFVNVTVWAAGSPFPWVAVNGRDCWSIERQGFCCCCKTVKETLTDCTLAPILNVTCPL